MRAIDLANRRIDASSGAIAYDSLVIALGSRTNYFGVPGVREHTYDFKSLEDSTTLRERVLDLCEPADHVTDEDERRALLTFAVVGGGYTGVELLTDLRDFLFDYVVRYFRAISRDAIRLVLVEAFGSILGGVHPHLARSRDEAPPSRRHQNPLSLASHALLRGRDRNQSER